MLPGESVGVERAGDGVSVEWGEARAAAVLRCRDCGTDDRVSIQSAVFSTSCLLSPSVVEVAGDSGL